MDIEGQLCWTGTVRRPGGQNTGWRMVSKDSNRTDSSVSGHLVTGCDTADGWGSENCWGVKRGRTMVGSCNHQCGESLNINGVLVKACQANLNWTIWEFKVNSANLFSDEPLPRQILRMGF